MNLASALDTFRRGHAPADGATWFTDGCAICGFRDKLVLDHCHVTGWDRGHVCVGCNLLEARTEDTATGDAVELVLHAWRRTAPLLARRTVTTWGRDRYLTDDDLAADATMDELFALAAQRRAEHEAATGGQLADVIGRMFNNDAKLTVGPVAAALLLDTDADGLASMLAHGALVPNDHGRIAIADLQRMAVAS